MLHLSLWLSPSPGAAAPRLLIHPLMEVWAVSTFQLLQELLRTSAAIVFEGGPPSLEDIPRSGRGAVAHPPAAARPPASSLHQIISQSVK